MKIPVVVIIFNRPDKAKKLYKSLGNYKPDKLFIISDGPRIHVLKDKEKVKKTREIFKNIDWKCKVLINYSDKNLGSRDRIVSGLNWVFQKVEKAIILEDDCIPSKEFFPFMEKMLDRYRANLKIGSVCGSNFFNFKTKYKENYFFSKYQHCWGWATWKNRWQKFDGNLKTLDKIKKNKFLKSYLGSYKAYLYWHWILDRVKNGKMNSWAYTWAYTGFINKYLHVHPKKNLIKYIGYDNSATNTKNKPKYNLKITNNSKFRFPSTHPSKILVNNIYDRYCEDEIFSKSLKNRLYWFLKKSWL